MNVSCGKYNIGDNEDLLLIAGPCALESYDLCLETGSEIKSICNKLGINYCFKASFDKANRTSVTSFRGPGMEKGLEILAKIKKELNVPIVTDIHESYQAEPVSKVADIIQIPAFLCRQTDLIVAAANTGKCINIKKGQFLAPLNMKNSVEKAKSTGNNNILLTERGSSFGYNYLVVDMTSFPAMRSLGVPVIIDATHSVQQPGGLGDSSGGAREYISTILKAATATGIDGIFMEVHPEPEKGLCDSACMFKLSELESLLKTVVKIRQAVTLF